MNKKADEASPIGALIPAIIAIAVLVIVVIGIVMAYNNGYLSWIKGLPSFQRNSIFINESYTGSIDLKYPDKVYFMMSGGGDDQGLPAKSTFFRCKSDGWYWSFDWGNANAWFPVSSTNYYRFKDFTTYDQQFITSLDGKSCETGIAMLISKTLNEDRQTGHVYSIVLTVSINGKIFDFHSNDAIMQNPERFIVQLNKYSE